MTDHELSHIGLIERDFVIQPELHFADPGERRFLIFTRWRRAAAGGFHVFGCHKQLAIAHFGDRPHVRVLLDSNPSVDVGAPAVRSEVENRSDRRWVLVDDEVNSLDVFFRRLDKLRLNRKRHDRSVRGALRRLQLQD
jgi:hypothetical protein